MRGVCRRPSPPSFLEYWDGLRDRLDREILQSVPDIYGDLPARQAEAMHRSLGAGKRIRGCLVSLICESLGGELEASISKAVAIECIQAASLIHDDYVDGDEIRRDRPAEWTLQGSRQAVLLGDVMFATAIGRMVADGVEEGRLAANVIASMAKGAYQEHLERVAIQRQGSAAWRTPEADYERIINLKTGTLFATRRNSGPLPRWRRPRWARARLRSEAASEKHFRLPTIWRILSILPGPSVGPRPRSWPQHQSCCASRAHFLPACPWMKIP